MGQCSKSKIIRETLRQEILSGKFDVVHKMPSDRMLMRRFSVARATVQSAMDDLREEHLIARQPGQGTFLLRYAKLSAVRRFGIIMPDLYYPFYARIKRGLELGAKRRGWSVVSASLGSGDVKDRAGRALDFVEKCLVDRVSGVFFQPFQFLRQSEKFNRSILDVLSNAGVPVVLIDSDFVKPPNRSKYDLVGIDNTGAGYQLAKHLIAAGAKRIIYFSNPMSAPTALRRGHGVGIAVTEHGLPWKCDNVFFADPTDVRAAQRLFASQKRPDGIVAVNDYVATLLLKTLKAIGVRVPKDVLLAGVNGDDIAAESDPPITTAEQPCEQIGEGAMELMLQRLESPDLLPLEVHFAVSILKRASTFRTKKKQGGK